MEPPAVTTQPRKLKVPKGARTLGSKKIPEPTITPTVKDQHAQNPRGLLVIYSCLS